jgi:putative transposase
MKRKRFTEEQIIAILRETDSGTPIREICRRHGISEVTFHRWRGKFGGMQVSDARRLKALEDENRRLKRLVADQALDIVMLKDVAGRKW